MRSQLLVVISLFISACSGPAHWEKPGVSAQDRDLALYGCERDTSAGNFGGGLSGEVDRSLFFTRCMRVHGWTLVKE